MDKNLKIGIGAMILGAGIWYWNQYTWFEMLFHFLFIIVTIVVGVFTFKVVVEAIKAGLEKVENFFNPTTPDYNYAYPQTPANTANFSPNTRQNNGGSSAGATAAEKIIVTPQKQKEIVEKVLEFIKTKTKKGRISLDIKNPVNTNLNLLAEELKVQKIVIVRTIENNPTKFHIVDNFAYSIQFHEEKLEETFNKRYETEVRFHETEEAEKETVCN